MSRNILVNKDKETANFLLVWKFPTKHKITSLPLWLALHYLAVEKPDVLCAGKEEAHSTGETD